MADKIVFGVEFDAKTGQAQLKTFVDGFEKVGNSAKLAGEKSKKSFSDAISGVERFSNLLSNLKGAFSQVFNSFSEAVGYSNQYETALTGLAKTAENFAQSQLDAKKAAIELSKDGLVNVTANATSLKFLMQSGFDLQQAMNLTGAAKDMGAFGRTTLDFNQAMIDFARGVKTGSLELTENIGFTQRFSAIMKTANVDISNGIDLRNNLAQREAFYNAVLKEGELNKGNAQKYLETTAGAMQAMSTQINILKKDIGDFVKIIIADLLPNIKSLVAWLKDNLAVVIAGLAVGIMLVLVPAVNVFITALVSLTATLGIATMGVSTLIGVLATFIAFKYADKMIEDAKATKEFNDKIEEATNSVNGLTEAQLRNKKIEAYSDMSKMSFALSDINKQIIKQIELQYKANRGADAFGFEKAQRNIETLREEKKALLENIKIKQAERNATDKALTATKKVTDPKTQTDAEKKAAEDKLKIEYDAIIESMNMSFESYEYDRSLNKKAQEEKLQNTKDIIKSETELEQEKAVILKQLADEQKAANEQWKLDNATSLEFIKGGYDSLTSGISAFIQTGINGGNALKAAWSSFSSSILNMIAQIIAKAIAMQAVLGILNLVTGGTGGFFTGAVKALTGEFGGLPSQFRPKLAGGGVLWQGASHAQGGIPVEVEGDEITLTKGVYRNPVLRGIASMINQAAGGVQIPNAPRASQLAAGGLPALNSSGSSSDNSIVMAMITTVSESVNGLTKQIERFKQTSDKSVFTMSANGQKEIMAVV